MNAWLSAARPRTLPAAAVPVLVGAAHVWHLTHESGGSAVYGSFRWLPFIAALVCALFIQVGTNLANDYYDHKKGADTPARAGPKRASASGAIPAGTVRNAAFATFGLAALLGLYLVFAAGWPVLVIGALSLLSGWLYTGGPAPLGYIGLGDLFAFVFFGPVAVMGTAFVIVPDAFHNTGVWAPSLFLGIEIGMLTTAILVVNNLRDRPTDLAAGKRTLATRIGDKGSRIEYVILVFGAFALMVAGSLPGQNHPVFQPRLLLPILALPLLIKPLKLVLTDHDDRRALNPALGQTALLLLGFGVLTAVGLLLH